MKYLQEALDAAKDVNYTKLAEDILTRVVITCLKKYQERLNVGAQDAIASILDTFKGKIAAEIFSTARGWVVPTNEKILFPQNCRFLYNIGRSTLVVIEEPLCVRTLTLDKNLLKEPRSGNGRITERHILPLPYVVFLLHFVQGRLAGTYVTWRTAPLSSLSDVLYEPLLPNMHKNLSVCMGADFSCTTTNVTKACQEIVDEFWSSTFNNDLSTFWWEKNRFPELQTVASWKDQDPIFMVNLPYNEVGTLESLMDICIHAHEEVSTDVDLKRRLHTAIDNYSERMFNKMMSYFRNTKFDRFYPVDLTNNVGEAVQSIAEEFDEVIEVLDFELKKLGANGISDFGWTSKKIV